MTPDEAGFLKAIAADPADETARLAYADWLGDHDDPRGAFARLSADFLRSVRGLVDLRRAYPPEWLEVMDPLLGRVRLLPIPDLGEGIEEGTLTAALVAPGATLAPGDAVAEISTDKASLELTAETRGVVLSVLVRPGDRVRHRDSVLAFLSLEVERSAVPPAWRLPEAPASAQAEAELEFGPDEAAAFELAYTAERGRYASQLVFRLATVRALRDRGLSDEDIRRELAACHAGALRYLLSKYGRPDPFAAPPGGA
jgi:uncharacterized protein (TIGR02996 family)